MAAAARPAASLEENIAAYNEMRTELEGQHFGECVVFHDRRLIGFYPTYANAANEAMEAFGDDPQFDTANQKLPGTPSGLRLDRGEATLLTADIWPKQDLR